MPYLTKSELTDILSDPVAKGGELWSRIPEDVDWTVFGTGEGTGRWHNLTELRAATVGRLVDCMDGPLDLKLVDLIIGGENNERTVMEMEAFGRLKNGPSFLDPIARRNSWVSHRACLPGPILSTVVNYWMRY